MYLQRNIEARSRDHDCSGQAMSITICVCVFVAVGIRHAMRVRHIVVWGLPRSQTFLHIVSQTARFSRGKSY